jgi:hypothetical protein
VVILDLFKQGLVAVVLKMDQEMADPILVAVEEKQLVGQVVPVVDLVLLL